MRPVHLLILILIIGGVAGGIVYMKKQEEKNGPPAVAASSGPPASAVFLEPEVQPLDVISGGNLFVGQWVRAPGWQVGITQVKEEDDGKSIRVELSQPSTLRGSAWIVAIVPEEEDVKAGQFVMLSGRIDDVTTFNDGGPVPGQRIIMRDVKVTRSGG